MIRNFVALGGGVLGLAVFVAVLAGFGVPMEIRIAVVTITTVVTWGIAYRNGWFDGLRGRP